MIDSIVETGTERGNGANNNNNDNSCTDVIKTYSYEEALEFTGHGRYNYMCLIACCVTMNAVAIDMFGFGVIVAASTCDLKLGMTETGLLNSVPFAGLLVAFPWGYFADTKGRRLALLISTSVGFVLASLSSLSPNWETTFAVKFFCCCFSTAAFTISITYLGECTNSRYRSRYIFILNSMNLASEVVVFSLAYVALPLKINLQIPWIGITFNSWRLLILLMALPMGFGSLLMYFLYESPEFLANRGDTDNAVRILRKIYKANGGGTESYPIKCLNNPKINTGTKDSFWKSVKNQTVPIFRPPLLKRTLQLFYLVIICCTTNNVFFMWLPKMMNSFFTSNFASEDSSFCRKISSNISIDFSTNENVTCNDEVSVKTIYTGICYGLFYVIVNLVVIVVANWRKMLLIVIFIISAISCVFVEVIKQPVLNMVAFILLQTTSVGVGIVTSYFSDLFPATYRGLVTSLGMMAARMSSLLGINMVGAVIIDYCSITFYSWAVFVFSGVLVACLLPADRKKETDK